MRKLLLLLPFLAGCATFSHKIVNWPDHEGILTADKQVINIVGNPRLTCYNKQGKVLADGLFVRVEDDRCTGDCTFLLVDEFGKDYIHVRNGEGNYCVLWTK